MSWQNIIITEFHCIAIDRISSALTEYYHKFCKIISDACQRWKLLIFQLSLECENGWRVHLQQLCTLRSTLYLFIYFYHTWWCYICWTVFQHAVVFRHRRKWLEVNNHSHSRASTVYQLQRMSTHRHPIWTLSWRGTIWAYNMRHLCFLRMLLRDRHTCMHRTRWRSSSNAWWSPFWWQNF